MSISNWRDPNQVNARRSLILMAAGAVAGLMLAGYALFTARGTSTLFVPPEDVALVNQQPISRSDFLLQLQTLFGVDMAHATAEQRRQVLNEMIREELFVQRGKELDVASTDPDVRSAMVNAVELEIAADAITTQPSDAALLDFYKAHPEKYSREGLMTVHDYVFPKDALDRARAAAAALQSGRGRPDIPAELRATESNTVGDEQFYFAARIHLGPILFDAAKALDNGAVSDPIPVGDSVHVLLMTRNTRPLPLSFDEARDQVLNDYRRDAIDHMRLGDEAFLRKRANILIADDLR
jgi:parvulin-like peptidyl-prolyl isomerase